MQLTNCLDCLGFHIGVLACNFGHLLKHIVLIRSNLSKSFLKTIFSTPIMRRQFKSLNNAKLTNNLTFTWLNVSFSPYLGFIFNLFHCLCINLGHDGVHLQRNLLFIVEQKWKIVLIFFINKHVHFPRGIDTCEILIMKCKLFF